ncbi:CmpA/NrtA family ABC transporter substrate-binding protein [Roseinatronobacter sp. S2]|uniref:CmpA/NrtA family ABC transporter substrate-binding protein n=1 Tax=Roseinatronobacter sp. S2 TaxID=3035471 RepID=UPI0024109493|nr:CmpA/NrtA family ABC transporter substrate-binding protein [Roseinatronobacter sp. S2]MCC5958451.1 ABC transporter substrate-binding protein [Paracoccaceae bacterium]WFE75887.1 CmpA/NrtA family ABC transporter substrate-binding protein [Roseinatronobacter sp. S2]
MNLTTCRIGFVPLLDMAPIVVAHEMGFAQAEGLGLDLQRAPSWSSLRDMLLWGQVDAAQMLAPVPVAMALGLGGAVARLDILQVLSINGDVIGVSQMLADRLRAAGHDFAFTDARQAATDLARVVDGPLRIGVPFPFSTHVELVTYWLRNTGLNYELCTIPPPRMADALAAGEVDAFCVGEPWGSVAVELGAGTLLLPSRAIWAVAPEKVLAARHDWVCENPALTGRLMRAIWRAAKWLSVPENRLVTSEILAQPEYVNAPVEVLDRALRGEMVISPKGEIRRVPDMIRFFDGAASFPWRSQAAWFAAQLAARHGLDTATCVDEAKAICRTDLYRQNLRAAGADLPGASEKLEGSLHHPTAVASERGQMILAPDAFFDGQIFDSSRKSR